MRGPTGLNAADFVHGPSPAPKRSIDLRPKASAPTGRLTPGRGGRRRMPRPGEGVPEMAKAIYDFVEPGYVHAARTGTVPESALGKGLLGLETALDLVPGAGKVVGMALPFGLMKKTDVEELQRQITNRSTGLKTDNPEIMEHIPPIKHQRAMIRGRNFEKLIEGATKKEVKKFQKKLRSLPPEKRPGIKDKFIHTLHPKDDFTQQLIGGMLHDVDFDVTSEAVRNSPVFEAINAFEESYKNIKKGELAIIGKVITGDVKRVLGHKQAADIVDAFIKTEGFERAAAKSNPLSKKMNRKAQAETEEAFRKRRKWEGETLEGMTAEDLPYGGFGFDDTPYDIDVDYPIDMHRARYFEENIPTAIQNRQFEQMRKSKPAQKKEILNQLQETGTYDPDFKPKKGFGEDAEALRQMQKDLQSYNPINMRRGRYAKNRTPFV